VLILVTINEEQAFSRPLKRRIPIAFFPGDDRYQRPKIDVGVQFAAIDLPQARRAHFLRETA
jgi:hypothetical protein